MAIVNTASASAGYAWGTNPMDLPITVPTTGSNRILTVSAFDSSAFPGAIISGVALLSGYSFTNQWAGGSSSNVRNCGIWILANPPTGSQTIRITFSTAPGWGTAIASVWTGVNTALAISNITTATGAGTSSSVTVTSTAGHVVVDYTVVQQIPTATVGAGQISIATQNSTGNGYGHESLHSWEAGASSVDMTWSFSYAEEWYAVGFSLAPAPAARTRAIDYSIDINDPAQRIFDPEGNIVPPWAVKADRWLRLSGLYNTGGVVYSSFVDDPALCYIESVTWDSDAGTLRIVTSRQHLGEIIMAQAAGRSTA